MERHGTIPIKAFDPVGGFTQDVVEKFPEVFEYLPKTGMEVFAKAKAELDKKNVPKKNRMFWCTENQYKTLFNETFHPDKCLSKYTSHTNKDRTMTDIYKEVKDLQKERVDIENKIYSFAHKHNSFILITLGLDWDYELPSHATYEDYKARQTAIRNGQVNKRLIPAFTIIDNCENTIVMNQDLVDKTNELIKSFEETVNNYNIIIKRLNFLEQAQRSLNDAELVKENSWLFDNF